MISTWKRFWVWLKDEKNRKPLKLILWVIALIGVAFWAVFTEFRKPEGQKTYTYEEHIRYLDSLEKKTSTELARTPPEEKEKRAVLEIELTVILAKKANPRDFEDHLAQIREQAKALGNFKTMIPPERIALAQKALEVGDTTAAKALLKGALARGKEQADKGFALAAEAAYRLGILSEIDIDYPNANQYFSQAVQLQRDNPIYLNAAGKMAFTLGRYSEAQPLLEKALAIRYRTMNPEHPDVANSLNNLAALSYAQGKYAEAEPLLRRSLEKLEKALGPEHPDVADSLNNLAELYRNQGKYGEAEPLHRRALAIREKALGPEHPKVANSLNNLAALYHDQGKYTELEPLHRRALTIREKALGPEHPDVAQSLNNLALLYEVQGKYGEAEPLCQRALAIWEKALGPEHPDVATSLNNLAALYHDQGKCAEAEPLYRRALAIRENALGPEHPNVATCLENYSILLKKMGREGEAAALAARAAAIRARHSEKNPAK